MSLPPHTPSRVGAIIVGALGLFILLALATFHPADLGLLASEPNNPVRNVAGVAGAWVAFIGRGGFGCAAFVLPLLCGLWAARLWWEEVGGGRWIMRAIGVLALLASLATLTSLLTTDPRGQTFAGGMVGYLLATSGRYYLGPWGTPLVALCATGLSWLLIEDYAIIQQRVSAAMAWIGRTVSSWRPGARRETPERPARRSLAPPIAGLAARLNPPEAPAVRDRGGTLPAADRAGTIHAGEGVSTTAGLSTEGVPPVAGPVAIRSTAMPKPKSAPPPAPRPRQAAGGFQLPSLDLLTTPPPLSQRQIGEDLQVNARILEETLREFGIEAKCVHVDRGPAVTRYELSPAPGMKITRIVSLADDLALVLKAASCHIIAPIPGKGLIGVEVPNSTSSIVYLKEILTSREFQQLTSPLALAIGKDVSGQPVVTDLRECPHLLVAGTTGSGKTVCLNSLLTGILCHAGPDDVKFLMIDPKMVELVLFNEIPHLVAPVVTDSKKAAGALSWAVAEMERRYQALAKAGARNIGAYNEKVAGATGPGLSRMPYLIIVIDELADLMIVASRDVEESITRLSQMSRAVGIHVILATQRPSVDVITGVIKANFPARIAFQVASKVDSRTILDMNGADKLLGRGDLMFLRPGTAKPLRVQGAFLKDDEIEKVVQYLKAQRQPVYDEKFIAQPGRPAEAFDETEKDELYEMAKKIVIETGQASTSFLQRRLRLGYARAARILDLMEQEGLVGPPQGSRPREILVDQQVVENSG